MTLSMHLHILAALSVAVTPMRTAPAGAPPARSTYNGRANQVKVHPPRLDEAAMVMDGRLDEAQWAQAALLTGFSQFSPNDGAAADDSTEVLVWYSATAIHFGIRAFETHGAPRATLADRDKISSDDNVQILLGTFNDGRQATVFAVNPLGVQADGTILEAGQARSGGFGSAALARDPTDVSPDFVFSSSGHVTSDGYVVEVRIPFKSLRYQAAAEQVWGLNVVRFVQHSGHEDSWTPARRSGLSFLAQSGTLEGLTDLRRGLVVDVNPEITQRSVGRGAFVTDADRYDVRRPALGGNARWGVTNNLSLNGTINPDFSQIESDAGQFTFDPRSALFFAEKRPFFLDGIEQFATPHNLVYTRRIIQPVGAAKLTGRMSGTSIALLSAVDATAGSLSRADHPVFNVARAQRDFGKSSKVGVTYTDRIDAGNYNRVGNIDALYLFGGVYSVQSQYAQSYTKQATSVLNAPLWHLGLNRNGKKFGLTYYVDGIHENFRALSGFISRPGIVTSMFDQRFTYFGRPGAAVESFTFDPSYSANWRYQSFVHQGDAIEKKLHFTMNAILRGGWNVGTGYFVETFGFDPALYANYRVQGVNGESLPFVGMPRIGNSEPYFSVGTPAGRRISANAFYLYGRDENFFEWAPSNIVIATYGLTARPTDKLRLNATYNLQSYNRRSEGSIVGNNRIPRVKMEYQLARPLFIRLVGEFDSFYRDALRDEATTGRPIIAPDACNNNVVGVTRACQKTSFRGDFLFSYQPNPGTVVFLGYGSGFADTRPSSQPFEFPSSFGFKGYNRTDDALFLKASYLFRL
ncbi:MAG: carbohydrate binding family 9 domain-containing protein [Gemmatimonadota bacterium]|nr:carbohydrate binding family 9 domain-containing protein [Gemmatimonadota bacterium]